MGLFILSKDASVQSRSVTLNDVKLASIYYPILLDLAQHKHCLTYGELIEKAKKLHPDNPFAKKALAVSTGRRLDVVRYFTEKHGYPDLSSLIINKVSEECGAGLLRSFDPVKLRAEVFAFDWTTATTDFDGYISQAEKKAATKQKKAPKIPKAKAEQLRYAYFRENVKTLPQTITTKRELIDRLIMEGATVEDAFSEAVSQLR